MSGPAWLAGQDFDIDATVPVATQKSQLNAMLESLLEGRFDLKVHRETETKSGFALVVGRNGARLSPTRSVPDLTDLTPEEQHAKRAQQAQEGLKAVQKRQQEDAENGTPRGRSNSVTWSSVTTAELAANLIKLAGAPVVDETGLTGKYSATVETWDNPDVPGGTVFSAVQKLGLKLEPRQVRIETVVVDQVSKTPTAN